MPTPADSGQTQQLPPLSAMMIVDVEKFSANDDATQDRLSPMIPDILQAALRRARLDDIWDAKQFPDSKGDGYLIGFEPARLPYVVDDFLPALQAELADRAKTLSMIGTRIRMRLSLHVGPVNQLNDPRIDSPVGTPMIDAHRLVDVKAVRVLLAKSDPDVTFLAAILSEQVVDWVIGKGGRSQTKLSQLVSYEVGIEEKKFSATAYLLVPKPSGELLAHGLLGVLSAGDEIAPAPAQPAESIGGARHSAPSVGDFTNTTKTVGQVTGSGNFVVGGDQNGSVQR